MLTFEFSKGLFCLTSFYRVLHGTLVCKKGMQLIIDSHLINIRVIFNIFSKISNVIIDTIDNPFLQATVHLIAEIHKGDQPKIPLIPPEVSERMYLCLLGIPLFSILVLTRL